MKIQYAKVWGLVTKKGKIVNVYPPDVSRKSLSFDKDWLRNHQLTVVRLWVKP